MQPINSKTTHKTIRIPSIESNQSKEKTIFQEMQDTDIQYRNDNIQNVDYLCQHCGKNCDSNSSAVQCDACDIWVHYKCERLDIKCIEEIENNFNCEYICCSCQALRSLQKDSITEATRGEEPSKCLAVEKQSIKIVVNTIGNKQKCALSKTTNELIDTNDHGDEQNVNYEETHLKEYGQPNLNGQNISIQEGESPSRRNIHENTPVNMNSNILKQEIDYLKQKLIHRDKTIKQKDSQSYKLQTEMSALKKELSTSRAYAIKLENDTRDVEHSLKIQKQKQGMNDARADNSEQQHSNYNQSDNESMKSWVLEQRIRQLELEVLRQDNKLNNLSDKMIDLRIDNSNMKTIQYRKPNRKNKQKPKTGAKRYEEVLINEKNDNEYDNYCFRQKPTEVHKERPPQQIVNRKRTMNSDSYDLRLETPDDYDEGSVCHDMKRKRSNNIPPRFQRLQKEKQEASKKENYATQNNEQIQSHHFLDQQCAWRNRPQPSRPHYVN